MSNPEHMTSNEAQIVQVQLSHVNEGMARQDAVLQQVLAAVAMLPVMQQQLSNVLNELSAGRVKMHDHDKRLQSLEQKMPGLLALQKYLVAGVIASMGMLGTALVKLVIIDKLPSIPPGFVQQAPAKPMQPTERILS